MKILYMAVVGGLLATTPLVAQVSLGIGGAQRIVLPPAGGATLVGFHFSSPDGSSLEDVFGMDALTAADDPANADGVYLWDDGPQAFVKYFQKIDGFFYKASDPEGSQATMSLEAGDALFLRSPASSTETNSFYISGNVCVAEDATTTFSNRIVFANPYPVDLNLNSTGVDWSAATAGELPTLADRVHIWNPDKAGGPGFNHYFLKTVGGSNLWHSCVSPFPVEDPVLPAGGGAIYTAVPSFSHQIVRPFDLEEGSNP